MPVLHAAARQAAGALHLVAGDTRAALPLLHRAVTDWCELEAPYEAARTRVLLGMACRSLGDVGGGQLELDAAGSVFRELEARPDLASVDALSPGTARPAEGRLTAREMQVLTLLATGATNRRIAVDLSISEKTVATHVSSIFTKLGLPSRSAATAYAYAHRLVGTASAELPIADPGHLRASPDVRPSPAS
jgi:DNA-binding CsgD family transcriptional regulator